MSNVGTFYIGTVSYGLLTMKTWNKIASLTLPVGVYIITGSVSSAGQGKSITIKTSINNNCIDSTYNVDNTYNFSASVTTITNLSKQTTITLNAFTANEVSPSLIEFLAVRIK